MTAGTVFTARGGFHGRLIPAAPARPATLHHPFQITAVLPVPATLPAPSPATSPTAPPSGGWRLLRRAVRWSTTLTMLALVVIFAAVAAMPAIDARAMIVLSGSMEPLVSAGDAAIIRDIPVEDLRAGDVITYHGIGGSKGLTTHRIIGLVPLDSGLHFQTQGDANATPDPDLAPATNVVGRYDGMIPYGGRALLLLNRPEAKIVLVALPALLMLVGELRTLVAALRVRSGDADRHGHRRLVLAGVTVLLAAAVGVTATAATMALLTDTVGVGDNTFSTSATF